MTAILFHTPHISRMLDAVEILLPAIPVMLYSGSVNRKSKTPVTQKVGILLLGTSIRR